MVDCFYRDLDPYFLKTQFNIEESEVDLLCGYSQEIKKLLDRFIDKLPEIPEAIKTQQKVYWKIFFASRVDRDYLKNRRDFGIDFSKAGFELNSYLALMNFAIEWWTSYLSSSVNPDNDPTELTSIIRKKGALDCALVSEAYIDYGRNNLNSCVENVTEVVENISKGNFTKSYHPDSKEEEPLALALNQLSSNLSDVIKQTRMISQGRYDADFTPKNSKDELGKSVYEMMLMLRDMAAENRKSAWIKTGQAELSNIIRGDQDLHDLGKNVIRFLAKYLGALVGTIYQVDPYKERTLSLIGSYAFFRRKGDMSKVAFGEGLVGQCAFEKETIVFQDVPEDYTAINSSLGEVVPKNIVVVPLQIRQEIIGVIELGTLEPFDELKMELLKQVSENIAISIKSSQNSEKMKHLLDESKRQSQILQIQQEELKCTNEELQAQQEKLRESNEELERQTIILRKSEEEIRLKNDELKEKTKFLEKQSKDLREKTTLVEQARNDIEAKALELERASKYKTEFLANMSHELRTPLNSLLILSKSLSDNDEGNLTSEQVESSIIINKSGQDLLSLINDILDLSKVEAGKLQLHIVDFSIRSLAGNLTKQFQPLAKQKGIELRSDLSECNLQSLRSDPLRLEQILKNFISNALKFTQMGHITLKVHEASPTVHFKDPRLNPENCIGFSVIDSGIGISKENQELIFQAFHQGDGSINRKYGGTGLGLSISKELSKLLKGEIHLESETNLGSTFTLYLPVEHHTDLIPEEIVIEEAPQDILPKIKDDRDSINSDEKTLLIIEDDPNFAKILMNCARKRSYKCLYAQDGKAGVELAQEFKPNGITLDLNLPDMEGMKILESLKENPATHPIPIHVISVDEDENTSFKKGAIGHLIKPVKMEDLERMFTCIEHTCKKVIKNVLVVEDSKDEQKAIQNLIKDDKISITTAETGEQAFHLIQENSYDCVILDVELPDLKGIDILKKLNQTPSQVIPPLIIYTSREMSKEEFQELHEYTSSFIVKGVCSQDRLLDELFLFLHKIKPMQTQIKDFKEAAEALCTLEDKKILIVDDDMRNTYALSGALRKKGMKIALADNGQMALEKIAAEPDIDLVLMDIMMPIMDGYEATRRIRLNPNLTHLPIIALTAKILPEDRNRALELGANDFLTKPVDLDKLLNLIKVWISHSKNLIQKG